MVALRNILSRRCGVSCSSLPSLLFTRALTTRLFVGGLSYYTTEEGLSEAFSKYGQVIEAKIITDRISQKSKGFGFVTFASMEEGHKAVDEMDGKPLNGRVIFVDFAKPDRNFLPKPPIARGPPEPKPES